MIDSLEMELRADLAQLEPGRFASHTILDRTPWLWGASRADYVNWKSELADGLGVDPYGVVVVGSACTGLTLNPKKQLFRQFRDDSDVDVAIISTYHFELAWKTLRDMGRAGSIPTKAQRAARKQHREYLVFDETIATDWILQHLPFGEEWRVALLESETKLPGGRHAVKARIYRDVSALRAYHVRNIIRLKSELELQLAEAEPMDEGKPLPVDGSRGADVGED